MPRLADEQQLRDSLEALELSLVTPVVSGDLVEWASALQSVWNKAEPVIRHEVRDLQRSQIEQIGKEDQELFTRVDSLKTESDELLQQMESLKQDIGRLGRKAPQIEPHENRAEPDFKALVEEGTAFIVRLRKQHVAVRTWLVEAFNRERGPGD